MIYLVVIDWSGKEKAIRKLPQLTEPIGYSRNKNVLRGIIKASCPQVALSMTRKYLLRIHDEMIEAFDKCIVHLKEHPEDYTPQPLKQMTIAESASIIVDIGMPYDRWMLYEFWLNKNWDKRIYSHWYRGTGLHIQCLKIYVPGVTRFE